MGLRGGGAESAVESLDSPRSGAIAQLGERLLCKQEVTGSNPVGSIREAPAKRRF